LRIGGVSAVRVVHRLRYVREELAAAGVRSRIWPSPADTAFRPAGRKRHAQ